VIYPNPGFPIYESQIRACGAVPVPIHLHESRGFSFDPDELESKITDKTRLLILNSPHNPTGGIIPRQDMEAIAGILRRHPQVWVFADEVYSQLCYEGEFVSISSFPDLIERTIVCDGGSKTWAMTGWRLGFAASRTLAPVFTRWVTNTESCASHISQWAAVEALNGEQIEPRQMREKFLERRDLIVGLLREVPGVQCQMPGGAFYAWPNVTEACEMIGASDSEEFRQRLLNEAGVAVLADIHFGDRVPNEGQHIRFSYAASNEAIRDGVARMARFIEKNSKLKKRA
jgi:aspartate/methionine/tyrosine aminotransferase